MNQRPLPNFKKGDRLSAAKFQALRDRVQAQRILPGQGITGLEVKETVDGTIIRVVYPRNRYLAQASGAITAAASATRGIPGCGSVTLYMGSLGTGGTCSASLISMGVLVAVLNPSSNSMTSGNGIDSGMYCWAEQAADGVWYVSPLECS